MTSLERLRPVPVILVALLAGACGGASEDGRRFETWAEGIAEIPIERQAGSRPSDRAGLRPADAPPVRVEVLSPGELWDARYGEIVETAVRAAPEMIETAAPLLTNAAATHPAPAPSQTAGLRSSEPTSAPRGAIVQLGAYSSREAAEAAWGGFLTGAAAPSLRGASPVYETVQREGRSLVRLRVSGLSATDAAGLCRLAAAWCSRT